MSLAIVGTDTGVGKTVVSALLLARYGRAEAVPDYPGLRHGRRAPGSRREREPALSYWKPVATGAERDRDALFVRTRVGDRAEVLDEEYRFNPPVSPHLAARLAGVEVELERLLSAWQRHAAVPGREIVVEGIGGVLVPLNERGDLFADLLSELKIPAVLVARTALGTINHTLLTIEALRAREIAVLGVVLDGPPSPGNQEAIERFGGVAVIDCVGPLTGGMNPSRAAVLEAARGFDPREALAAHLGREPESGPEAAADG